MLQSRIVALVPVKDPRQAKTRLTGCLTNSQRSELVLVMLEDVLETLVAVTDIETAVVSSDDTVRQVADQYGVNMLADQGVGETAVVEAATRMLVESAASGSLVIPGDVPLVSVEEVRRILAAGTSPGSVLVPSRSGRGSNAVLRMPADLFRLQFGDDSFGPHLARARATKAPCEVLHLPRLGLDVDEPDDLRELLTRPAASRTHEFLSGTGWPLESKRWPER